MDDPYLDLIDFIFENVQREDRMKTVRWLENYIESNNLKEIDYPKIMEMFLSARQYVDENNKTTIRLIN